MPELVENFNVVLENIEKVRKKELLYMVFSFKGANTSVYEIREVKENPSIQDRFTVKEENSLQVQFDEFKRQVKEYGCCYALFDFEANHQDGTPRSTIFLFILIPDGYNVKEKFLYSFHLQQFMSQLNTAVKLVQINQYDDLNYENMKKMCLTLKKA